MNTVVNLNLEAFPAIGLDAVLRLGFQIRMENAPAKHSRRAFLTSHVSDSASTVQVEPQKQNPARSASFYLDNLDGRRRVVQWAELGTPELAFADANYEIYFAFKLFSVQCFGGSWPRESLTR